MFDTFLVHFRPWLISIKVWWKTSLFSDCREITPECGQCARDKCIKCIPGFTLKNSKCEGMHEYILQVRNTVTIYVIQKASHPHSLPRWGRVNFYETQLAFKFHLFKLHGFHTKFFTFTNRLWNCKWCLNTYLHFWSKK